MGDIDGEDENNAFEIEGRRAVQKQKKRALQSYSDFDVFEKPVMQSIWMLAKPRCAVEFHYVR